VLLLLHGMLAERSCGFAWRLSLGTLELAADAY